VLSHDWPRAVQRAVTGMWDAVCRHEDPLPAGQYHLALTQLTKEVTDRLGPVELVRRTPPRILAAADLAAATDSVEVLT
jgi:hypothetical protein